MYVEISHVLSRDSFQFYILSARASLPFKFCVASNNLDNIRSARFLVPARKTRQICHQTFRFKTIGEAMIAR
jgi:hypothetical protein